MKKAWRLRHNPHLLVAKVFLFPRLPDNRIHTARRQISWERKGLILAEKTLHTTCKWEVGDGNLISAATDYWVNGNKALFRDNIPLAAVTQLKVAHLILPEKQG